MINKIFFKLFHNAFSASFDNQKVGKHHLTIDIVSAVTKNLKIWGYFA